MMELDEIKKLKAQALKDMDFDLAVKYRKLEREALGLPLIPNESHADAIIKNSNDFRLKQDAIFDLIILKNLKDDK